MPGKYVFGEANYQIADQPLSITVCDFNGDGIPDVATTSWNTSTISLVLGNPDGTVHAGPSISAALPGGGLACGDFDHDNKIDLATVNSEGALLVYLGNGDGTFKDPTQYAVLPTAQAVAVADLNGDSKFDLIVAGGYSVVQVLYGNGDGTFKPHVDYGISSYGSVGPQPIAVGDLNGDGRMDIAVANGAGVSVLLANNSGGFQPYVQYNIAQNVYTNGVIMADFNGDHKLDLAVAVNAYYGDAGYIAVLLGVGNGTFLPATAYATAYFPASVAAADLNGDGKIDLLTANQGYSSSGSFTVLIGNGDGTFKPHVDYETQPGPALGLGDFNGDGNSDVTIASEKCLGTFPQCAIGNLSIILGRGDGTFPGQNYLAPSRATALTAADFNDDGNLDLAVGNENQQNNNTLSVLLNQGNGAFQPHTDYAAGSGTSSVVSGDFNHDERQDVAVANFNDNTVSVLLGNGNGTLQSRVDYATGAQPQTLLVDDFNHDGILDLVTVPYLGSSISILLGKGDGTFQPHKEFQAGDYRYSAVAGDFNRDGNLDLVVTSLYSTPAMVIFGKGDGTFGVPGPVYGTVTGQSVAAGDFNGDGKLDLALSGSQGPVMILLGNGDGSFQAPVSYPDPEWVSSVTVADVDGDGQLDLVAVGNNDVGVLYGNGDGTFKTFVAYSPSPFQPSGLALANLAGNGGTDMAVSNWGYPGGYGGITVLLNNPVLAVYPNNFTFPPQFVGNSSQPQTFLISNPGSAPVKLSTIFTSAQFSQSNNCPATLGIGESCTITATFSPTEIGPQKGTITIQDNALAGTQLISLSGIAYSALQLSRTTASFAAAPGKSNSQQVVLSNQSSADVSLASINIIGRDSSDFSQTNDCNNIVHAHGSCTFTLTFKPAKTGIKLGGLYIKDTAPYDPAQIVVLRGISRY